MKEFAITARAAQLVAHNMHNLVEGCSFFSDHEFLGGLYGTYEEIYDSVVERMIGLDMQPDLMNINRSAMAEALQYDLTDADSCDMFEMLLTIEMNIQKWAQAANEAATYGSKNFLQGIADNSEMRVYKLKQRTKGIEDAADEAAEPVNIIDKETETQ